MEQLDRTAALRALIAENAYRRFEARGRQDGHALEDWLAAEAELGQHGAEIDVDEASRESFPASDPPSWTATGSGAPS